MWYSSCNTSQDNKTSIVSVCQCCYLVEPPRAVEAAVGPETFPWWRMTDFAGHCHHLHRQELLRPRLPAGFDEERQVVGLTQVGLREPELLAGCVLPLQTGSPGPEREVGVVAGRDPRVLQPALSPGRPVVLAVPRRGAHAGSPGVPAGPG